MLKYGCATKSIGFYIYVAKTKKVALWGFIINNKAQNMSFAQIFA